MASLSQFCHSLATVAVSNSQLFVTGMVRCA